MSLDETKLMIAQLFFINLLRTIMISIINHNQSCVARLLIHMLLSRSPTAVMSGIK